MFSSGFGDEKQNEAIEKAYENAQTKGWRPCELGLCSGGGCAQH